MMWWEVISRARRRLVRLTSVAFNSGSMMGILT